MSLFFAVFFNGLLHLPTRRILYLIFYFSTTDKLFFELIAKSCYLYDRLKIKIGIKMTASLGNFQNGSYGSNLDSFVYPQLLSDPMRAPTVNDIFSAGTRWVDNSVNPKIIYETTGAGNWYSGTGGITFGTSEAMIAGTTTVNTTAVKANSIIILSTATPGGTVGTLSVGTITEGTSFVINSSSNTDTSTVNYLILN